MLPNCHIVSGSTGRVMLTTEKVEPKLEAVRSVAMPRPVDTIPDHTVNENIYRVHVHVIPDEQHQFFKLVDQV